jgi:hypothetical protein
VRQCLLKPETQLPRPKDNNHSKDYQMKPIIEKIQKLLALSESANQHEAELAAQKAQELLSKYNLTLDSISIESNSNDVIDIERYEFMGSMKKWRNDLMWNIVQSVDCDAVFHFHKNVITAVTIYGLDQNVKVAIYMYKYLENSINILRKAYVKQYNKLHKERTGDSLNLNQRYHIEKSYTLGIVKSVGLKLRQQKVETPPTPGALVPIIGALIEQKKQDDFKNLKTMKSKKTTIYAGAFNQGQKDGEGIAIHQGITNTCDSNLLAIGY